jgi:hypothetical protein
MLGTLSDETKYSQRPLKKLIGRAVSKPLNDKPKGHRVTACHPRNTYDLNAVGMKATIE